MDNQQTIKQDKEYRDYIDAAIQKFNSNGKKTIVYFCDCYYPIVDGVIKVLENYAKRICSTFNVIIIAPKHKNKIYQDSNDFLLVGVSGIFMRFLNYDLAFPKLDARLKHLLDRINIDVIHAHSPFSMGAYGAKYAKKRGIPFVMTMHSQYKMDFMRYVHNERFANMMTKNIVKVFNQTDETWTMHKKVADALRSYGYEGKFYYMPNATDYPRPDDLQSLRKIGRKKLGVSDDTKILLFVGRIVKQKNVFLIADALKRVKDNGVKFKAVFVGNGPDKLSLQAKIDQNGTSKDTIFTGRIDDRNALSEIYAASDIFLFPSLYDTSSLVQIEAAVHETPGIFIKGTATANTITDGVTGFLCENSEEDFANKIIEISQNDELLKTVGKTASERLYVTWDDLTNRICKRYDYLIENKEKKDE